MYIYFCYTDGNSFPGFMIPAGSSWRLSARRASTPCAPTSAPSMGVVAPDAVVVGDRAAVARDRVARRALDRLPLLDLHALALPRQQREVQRGTGLVEV